MRAIRAGQYHARVFATRASAPDAKITSPNVPIFFPSSVHRQSVQSCDAVRIRRRALVPADTQSVPHNARHMPGKERGPDVLQAGDGRSVRAEASLIAPIRSVRR